jgi:hypothetical protein
MSQMVSLLCFLGFCAYVWFASLKEPRDASGPRSDRPISPKCCRDGGADADAVRGTLLCITLLTRLTAARAADDTTDLYDGTWRFGITPYVWAPRIDGLLNFTTTSGSKPVVSLTPINYFDNLNVPFMITGEVHHGAWSALTDLVWVDFSGERAVVKSVSGPAAWSKSRSMSAAKPDYAARSGRWVLATRRFTAIAAAWRRGGISVLPRRVDPRLAVRERAFLVTTQRQPRTDR